MFRQRRSCGLESVWVARAGQRQFLGQLEVGMSRQKTDVAIADANQVPMTQCQLLYTSAIDSGAVEAAEVNQPHGASIKEKFQVAPAHAGVVNLDVAACVPPDKGSFAGQFDLLRG